MKTPFYTLSLLFMVLLLLGPVVSPPAKVGAQSRAVVSQAPVWLADPQTRTFRQGLEGYTGAKDTYIQHESYDPHGVGVDNQMVHVKETSWGTKRTLMRFELSSIPHYMEIVQARLELNVGYRYPETAVTVNFYHLLKPWDDLAATWYTTGLGDWGSPGAGAQGVDYETPAFATAALPTTNGFQSVDVTAAVQRWVQNPITNYGFVIRGGSSVDVRCWSSDRSLEGERPRLIVTYQLPPNITPPPTYTPTPTYTPVPAPSATPTPANVISSTGVAQAFPPDDYYRRERDCLIAGPYPGNPSSGEVILVWEGVPTSAKLTFRYANNNDRAQAVMVNDQLIGRLPGANYASACTGGTYAEIPFDPALVRSGLNKITITADVEGETNTWSLQELVIQLGGMIQGSDIRVANIVSSFDGTVQRAMVQKPVSYHPGTPTPLVIALHGWGGRDYDALMWFAKAASDRGWLLACPDTRATFAHTPTKAVQRDVVDLIDWMVASPDYNVDTSRVYIVGSSMGGMMASVIAAKYPDRFAALAEFKGPTDLIAWYNESPSRQANIAKDCDNHSPGIDPFAYQRKSVSSMPMNLANMPTLIVHGTEDTVVPYHHATDLKAGLDYYCDLYYGGVRRSSLYAYDGGHYEDHPSWGAAEVLGFFATYTLNTNPLAITVRTDEPKAYYWLSIAYGLATGDHWTQVNAWRDPGSQSVTLDVYDERNKPVNVTLDLARIGLPTGTGYTVEDTNTANGAFQQTRVQAAGHLLTLSVPGDQHRLVVYAHDAPQPQTVVLAHGQNGYSGVADTYIEAYVPGANHASESLRLTNGGNRSSLIRFDLQSASQLPPTAVIKSAQLRLYVGQKWDPAHSAQTSLYRLLKPWDVNAATWQRATSADLWTSAGAGAADEDFAPMRIGPVTMNTVPQWYSFNVTSLVQDWMRNPSQNYGVVIRAESGTGTFTLNSSESASNRPELVIAWAEATPTPSVTETPWATATHTPTATVPTASGGRMVLPLILTRGMQ